MDGSLMKWEDAGRVNNNKKSNRKGTSDLGSGLSS